MNLWSRLLGGGQHKARLEESENVFTLGARMASGVDRDRQDYDREELLRLALEAWRVNPLARRIVGLTTQYVVGGGLRLRSADADAHAFLQAWWGHRLNQCAMRVYEWCDELTRAGELFLLVSTDAAGMSYVRAVAASEIEAIDTAENDLQQETGYWQKQAVDGAERVQWAAYDQDSDSPNEAGSFGPVMLHYAINRPVGAVHGESDLAPLLKWLSRYAAWLEDRARLNRYRNSFLFTVKGRWQSEAQRSARQAALVADPPSPGSILVTDESEQWEVLSPKLESADANEDGLALKKMIAAGSGLPLHFLAEPEGSNRSSAESAGGPTYRHFEQRQEFFCWLVADVARVALRRRAQSRLGVPADAIIEVQGSDLSGRDNAGLAVATSTLTSALLELRQARLIDDAELLRMVYRFAGEVVDVDALLARAAQAGALPTSDEDRPPARGAGQRAGSGRPPGVKIDGDTGEARGAARIG